MTHTATVTISDLLAAQHAEEAARTNLAAIDTARTALAGIALQPVELRKEQHAVETALYELRRKAESQLEDRAIRVQTIVQRLSTPSI